MRLSIAGLILIAAQVTATPFARAQDVPPRPIEEMVADFDADPWDIQMLGITVRDCPPRPGTWQFEYLTGVLSLPVRPELDESLASFLAAALKVGCESDLLSRWLRDFLVRSDRGGYLVARVAAELGNSTSEENRLAALRAMFDPRYNDLTRGGVAGLWVVDSSTPLHDELILVAEAYDRVDGVPPAQVLAGAIPLVRRREGEGVGLEALRALLDAVTERPDAPGAISIMNGLLSNAVNLEPDDPWMQELGAAAEEFADGRRPAPSDVRQFVSDRLDRFCRGPEAFRNPKCQP